jgi:hypothetical protein
MVQTHMVAEQTKLVHFYGVRDDLTDFVHVHPTMAPDGTWSVALPFTEAGPHHVYAAFLFRDSYTTRLHKLVLSRPLLVPGDYRFQPLPPPTTAGGVTTAGADGYTITIQGRPRAWTVMLLPSQVTRDGAPVTGLESYLDAYAHMTSFRLGNDALGHAHPLEQVERGRDGGPNLTFHVEFPGAGPYRVFIEFQAGGQLHTVPLTLDVA